ncbi:hypothetical protein N7516_011553 [Penicillium verrucosum]|uniref:uncharacterized protein n=1 Tax=Penicillium verrucosum TaxID=60171 RepID=UPI0025452A17|nr:uncharacterized protein N7516_011553 [Penicillium verrucosum]KAJ5920695.1 hypothetical protein N7516_011553 [Penicillium verrucosum]
MSQSPFPVRHHPRNPHRATNLKPPRICALRSSTTFDLFFFFFFFFFFLPLAKNPRETEGERQRQREREREAKWMAGEEGHGKKRPAEADPDGAQPLTKRFGYLRIDNSVPISARTKPKGHIEHIQHIQHNHQHNQHNQEPFPPNDAMILDDTKHTTYIHNLDQELMEADSPGLVFSPFVQKVLSVPQSVLSDSKPSGKELVLYTEPYSLTVPKEKDNVRRAILESRARARETKVPEDLYDDPMDIDS